MFMPGLDVKCSDDVESSSILAMDSLGVGAGSGEAVNGVEVSVRELDSACEGVVTCCSAFGSDRWQAEGTKISIPKKKVCIGRQNRSREEQLSWRRSMTGLFF